MGISPRVHFFDKYGKIQKIPYRKFERLLSADKLYITLSTLLKGLSAPFLYVEIESRQAIKILHCNYLLIPFNQ